MMKGGMAGLMKQAQQMQANMQKAQEELASVEVEGQSGAGAVKVLMTCKHDVKRVTIDPSVMDDKEMLEDLLAPDHAPTLLVEEAGDRLGVAPQDRRLAPGAEVRDLRQCQEIGLVH